MSLAYLRVVWVALEVLGLQRLVHHDGIALVSGMSFNSRLHGTMARSSTGCIGLPGTSFTAIEARES